MNDKHIYFYHKNLGLTTQDNWLEYCALKFQSGNQFIYDFPRELLRVNEKMYIRWNLLQKHYGEMCQYGSVSCT